MNRLFIFSLLVILTVSAVVLPGCKKEAGDISSYDPIGNTKKDTLRIFNLLEDISSDYQTGYLVYLNDSLIKYEGKSFFTAPIYGAIPAVTIPAEGGTFNIKLTKYKYSNIDVPPLKNPGASSIVCQTNITVPPHSGYGNILFYDDGGKANVKYIPLSTADPGAPSPGKFKVRLVNFGYEMPVGVNTSTSPANSSGPKFNLQMQYADSTIITGNNNVRFAEASNYQEMDYGTQQFRIYNTTNSSYIDNSGPLDDVLGTFNLIVNRRFPTVPSNYLFPNIGTYLQYDNVSTLQYGNIGSYPFSAGACYTILVIGNMYSVSMDRRYGAGELDNFGKVQIVNANPEQQEMAVKITHARGQITIPSLQFGKYSDPQTVPAGPISCEFSYQGKTIYTYTSEIPRLSNYTFYYTADLNGLPFIFPKYNAIANNDYQPGSLVGPYLAQLCKVTSLRLSPDAGNIFYTYQNSSTGGLDVRLDPSNAEISYKATGSQAIYDGTKPVQIFNIRLSSKRNDTLANKRVATLTTAFKLLPAPGSYTLVTAGLLNTADPAKKIRLFMVKHTNQISKAN